jgi:uncharacterized protein (DUF4415 family)
MLTIDYRPTRILRKCGPAIKAAPAIVARYRGQRGAQKSKPVKTQLTLRLDPDVGARFKAWPSVDGRC